jgi:hypothetical protein
MGFTVVHRGGTNGNGFNHYLRLLRQKGVALSDGPRTRDPITGDRWLHVWSDEQEAKAFVKELKKQSKDAAWSVAPVNGEPSQGPLGPITLRMGLDVTGIGFDLATFSQLMIQERFPHSCRPHTIFIAYESPMKKPTQEELRRLAEQVLPLLTELSAEELAVFGGFHLVQDVGGKEILSSTTAS